MIQCILQLQIVLILIFIHFYEGEALDEKLTKAITERYVSEIIGALTKNESKMDHLRSETKLFINPKSLLLKENYHESKAMQIFLKKHVIHLSEKQVDLNEFSLFQEVIMENRRLDGYVKYSGPSISKLRLRTILENVFTVPRSFETEKTWKKDVGNFITGQIHSSGLIGGIQLFECQTLYINETTMNNNMFGKNIFGIYPGKKWGTPEDEIVIIGSHWDTLETTDGLNDNGSGSAGILEITRAFMARNVIPDNSFIVVAFDVEEYGLQGSLFFVEKFLIPKILLPYGIKSPPRVIILDTLLNYDTKSESQFIPENWVKPAPKAVSWVKKNKNQGDFLAIYNREKTDAGLVETLKKQLTKDSKLKMLEFDLKLNKSDRETISSNVEFLTSDHTRFWFPKNILASGFHAILVTDTGPYRGEMAKCYHSACDSLRFGYTASFKNYDYYLESISLIYDAVVEMTTTPTKNTLMNPFNLFNLDESSSMVNIPNFYLIVSVHFLLFQFVAL
ncbi:uncharacterized protein [Lepeophtheirus salmonis]|nr:uncharacterized protein LOC121130547 [Lepeophtheirus salmonis]